MPRAVRPSGIFVAQLLSSAGWLAEAVRRTPSSPRFRRVSPIPCQVVHAAGLGHRMRLCRLNRAPEYGDAPPAAAAPSFGGGGDGGRGCGRRGFSASGALARVNAAARAVVALVVVGQRRRAAGSDGRNSPGAGGRTALRERPHRITPTFLRRAHARRVTVARICEAKRGDSSKLRRKPSPARSRTAEST